MRLFLTYLWVGGAVLYTLNTLAYTYLEPPERPTAVSTLTSDKTAPRKVSSWGSHLAVESPDTRPERRSDPIEVPQPLAEMTGSEVATSAEVEEPHVPDANEADPKAAVPGMKTGTTIPRVPHNEETATASGPSSKIETSEDPARKQSATKTKTAKLEEPASASSAAPQKRVTERRSPPPPVVGLRDPVEPRFSRREKRRADRAGLGVFRFGPQGF